MSNVSRLLCLPLAFALVSAVACSSSSDEPTPTGAAGAADASAGHAGEAGAGAGGAGTGGTEQGGAGQGGASAGMNGGNTKLPGCLQELFDSCPAGACTYQNDDQGKADHYCYGNGVTGSYTFNHICMKEGDAHFEVRKADGSLCYTVDTAGVSNLQACEHGSLTWKDASGQVVATGSFSSGVGTHRSISCQTTTETYSCGPTDCPEKDITQPDCQPGVCP